MALLVACAGETTHTPADAARDVTGDAGGDAVSALDHTAGESAGRDALADQQLDAPRDASPDSGPFVPSHVQAELIASGPVRVSTPPSWNAHLPKLVSDGTHYYAIHTHFTVAIAGRHAAILRRPVAGGSAKKWVEVARVAYPHQPPGVVVDTKRQLHLVFDCLRPAGQAVSCFVGGAGTGTLTSRFYHLVFSARDTQGALRFDAYANHNDYAAHSNGYMGIGTTAAGDTVWALADASWQRVVQRQAGGAGPSTTIATLSAAPARLLYPIIGDVPQTATAGAARQLVLFAGEFDPQGGNNASYLAATAYRGPVAGPLVSFFRRTPGAPAPGKVGTYPSALAVDPLTHTVNLVLYRLDAGGACESELWRFDGGLAAAPTRRTLGCRSTYAKLQIASSGVYYLLDGGSGGTLRLGVSADRGDSWSWRSLPIQGLPASAGDTSHFGAAPIAPFTAPLAYDADVLRFSFSGSDGGGSRHSYFGEIALR
jgi:hypothetical protein